LTVNSQSLTSQHAFRIEEVAMVHDRDPDQDLSNRPPSTKHTRWELSTLVIGLIVILTGSYLIITGPPSAPQPGFQRIEAGQNPW
jgi:hypothetical protein